MATITLQGTKIHTIGNLPELGSTLKSFNLVDVGLQEKSNMNFQGKKKIFNIFPSVDTGICATSARKFNVEASKLDNTIVINVSKDLPFALKRFCAAEGISNVETLSDFRGNFGEEFGMLIIDSPMKGLLSRAIIVTDENDTVVYTEQVSEIAQEPNYDLAINALK